MALKLYKDTATPPAFLYVDDATPPGGDFSETDDPIDWNDAYKPLRNHPLLPDVTNWRDKIHAAYEEIPRPTPGPTTDQDKVAAAWFVIDEADRDAIPMSAADQEAHARRLVIRLDQEAERNRVEANTDLIKDADVAAIDVEVANKSKVPGFATGTYTGDGTTSMAITGLGFEPKFLQIYRRETTPGTGVNLFFTTDKIIDDHANGGSVVALNTDPEHKFISDAIISLDVDGFTVDDAGTDLDPNKLSQIYSYVAFG